MVQHRPGPDSAALDAYNPFESGAVRSGGGLRGRFSVRPVLPGPFTSPFPLPPQPPPPYRAPPEAAPPPGTAQPPRRPSPTEPRNYGSYGTQVRDRRARVGTGMGGGGWKPSPVPLP